MKHRDALNNQAFDTRMINWNLKRGVITEAQVKEYLNNLSDVATNARTIEIEVEEATTEEVSLN